MADEQQITDALNVLKKGKASVILLHCTSIYPTPDATSASKDMHLYFIKRIQDVGAYTNATDLPFRFVPCMVSGLAYYLSMKYNPQLTQQMKLLYEDEFQRALQEDGPPASVYISPKTYYPEI